MSQEYLDIIKKAIVKTGDLAMEHQAKLSSLKFERKKSGSPVSQADLECENLLKEELNKHFKYFSFLAEEGGLETHDSDYMWIIDPIDGTTNFLKGLPQFGCCVCLQEKGKTIISAVYFPALGELYYASKDRKGAFLEFPKHKSKEPVEISVSKERSVRNSIIAYGMGRTNYDKVASMMKKLCAAGGRPRTIGAASMDIIRVANGTYEAFVSPSIPQWDIHPAGYIAEKAGGRISDIYGRDSKTVNRYTPEKEGCIISNGIIAAEIAEVVKPTLDRSIEVAREVYTDKICPLANKAVETSTPYIKDACSKSGPLWTKTKSKSIELWRKSKPYQRKTWEAIVEGLHKSKPYAKKALIWLKDMLIRLWELTKKLFYKLKDKVKK